MNKHGTNYEYVYSYSLISSYYGSVLTDCVSVWVQVNTRMLLGRFLITIFYENTVQYTVISIKLYSTVHLNILYTVREICLYCTVVHTFTPTQKNNVSKLYRIPVLSKLYTIFLHRLCTISLYNIFVQYLGDHPFYSMSAR